MAGKFGPSPQLAESVDADTPDDVAIVDPTVGRPRKPSGPRTLRAGSVQWEPDLTAKLRVECAKEDLTRRAVHNVLLRYFLTDAPKDVRRELLAAMKTWERQQKGMAEP